MVYHVETPHTCNNPDGFNVHNCPNFADLPGLCKAVVHNPQHVQTLLVITYAFQWLFGGFAVVILCDKI